MKKQELETKLYWEEKEERRTSKNNPYLENYEEIKNVLKDCSELNKSYPYQKRFRLEGDTFFLTYFTDLSYEEIIDQLKLFFERKFRSKLPLYIVSSYYGKELTSSNKMHIHIYIKFNRLINITKPDTFDLLEEQTYQKICGHYEKCRDEQAAIWYLRYHAENNIKNDMVTTLRNINVAKDSEILEKLSNYYLSCFEVEANTEDCLDKTMIYFLENYKQKLSLFDSIRSSLKKQMKLKTRSIRTGYLKKLDEWEKKDTLKEEKVVEFKRLLDRNFHLCFEESDDETYLKILSASKRIGIDEEKIGIFQSFNQLKEKLPKIDQIDLAIFNNFDSSQLSLSKKRETFGYVKKLLSTDQARVLDYQNVSIVLKKDSPYSIIVAKDSLDKVKESLGLDVKELSYFHKINAVNFWGPITIKIEQNNINNTFNIENVHLNTIKGINNEKIDK